MPLDEVKTWFMKFVVNHNKNYEPFLTVDQLGQFIDRAFCEVSLTGKLTINVQNGEKSKVVGLFHLYYQYCITHRSKQGKTDPNASTEKYIKLLTDHFDNWTFEEVRNNFRKGGDWK